DDNVYPRGNIERISKSKKFSPEQVGLLKRLEAAERNSWDGLPIICTAIVAGNTAGLSANYLNAVAGIYLGLRLTYVYLYATVTDPKKSYARSLVYWLSN
ncbi:hypothetical protein BD324DRAFT_568650, partial [Kockovaella imperatae]